MEKLVLLSFRGYLGEIESGKKTYQVYLYIFRMCNVVPGSGQRFQFSSRNSRKRWRCWSFRKRPFFLLAQLV